VTKKQKLLIATPSYGGTVTVEYFTSIRRLEAKLKAQGVEVDLHLISFAQVDKVRSYFATRLLLEPFTHLLFVDADMSFDADTVMAMLALDEPVTAVAYPKRTIDFKNAHAAFRKHEQFDTAMASALEFVFEGDLRKSLLKQREGGKNTITLRAGRFIEATMAGTGLMLIQKAAVVKLREVFADLWVGKPVSPYSSFGPGQGIFQCFEALKNKDGVYLSEDASFCQRWVQSCGGTVWVNVVDPIGHTGAKKFESTFVARYLDVTTLKKPR